MEGEWGADFGRPVDSSHGGQALAADMQGAAILAPHPANRGSPGNNTQPIPTNLRASEQVPHKQLTSLVKTEVLGIPRKLAC